MFPKSSANPSRKYKERWLSRNWLQDGKYFRAYRLTLKQTLRCPTFSLSDVSPCNHSDVIKVQRTPLSPDYHQLLNFSLCLALAIPRLDNDLAILSWRATIDTRYHQTLIPWFSLIPTALVKRKSKIHRRSVEGFPRFCRAAGLSRCLIPHHTIVHPSLPSSMKKTTIYYSSISPMG